MRVSFQHKRRVTGRQIRLSGITPQIRGGLVLPPALLTSEALLSYEHNELHRESQDC